MWKRNLSLCDFCTTLGESLVIFHFDSSVEPSDLLACVQPSKIHSLHVCTYRCCGVVVWHQTSSKQCIVRASDRPQNQSQFAIRTSWTGIGVIIVDRIITIKVSLCSRLNCRFIVVAPKSYQRTLAAPTLSRPPRWHWEPKRFTKKSIRNT